MLRGALHAIVDLAELEVGDGLAVDANALVEAHQMRRRVQPGLVPGDTQDGRQRRRSGTFAVGAGNEHAGETPLGMAERFQHLAHVGQVELVRGSACQLVPEGV